MHSYTSQLSHGYSLQGAYRARSGLSFGRHMHSSESRKARILVWPHRVTGPLTGNLPAHVATMVEMVFLTLNSSGLE